MAAAVSLDQAAQQAFDNLFPFWLAGNLRAHLISFWTPSLPVFPEQADASHPISNWLAVIAALAQNLPAAAPFPANPMPYQNLVDAANYVFRCCYIGNKLKLQGSISNAQAATLLANYNAAF